MAAKRGSGESRVGLVVFLVLFILVSIGLGITTYYGYEEANNQKKAAEAKEKEAKDWTRDANYWKFLALTYRAYTGVAQNDPTAEAIPNLRSEYEKGNFSAARDDQKEVHSKTLKEVWSDQNPTRKWDGKRPVVTYQEEIDKLNQQVAATKLALKAAEDKAKLLDEDVKAKDREIQERQTAYAKNLLDKDTSNKDEQARKDQKILMLQGELDKKLDPKLAQLDDQKKEIDHTKRENERLTGELTKTRGELKKTKEELAGIRAVPEDIDITRIAPENLATVDRIDRNGQTLYISLGSADSLRRQVTFSIYGKGVDGRPLKEPKGKLEVVRITGEHSAQTQITDLRDDRRDPVLPGDFIYNPSWRANHTQHVVLIGIMDLTGDGRDSTQQLIRDLKGQGIEVDAYMDLRTNKLKKPNSPDEGAITRDTDMVIVGTTTGPNTAAVRAGAKDDPKQLDMINAMQTYQKKASELAVRIVRLDNFLESSGFPLPKTLAPDKVDFHRNLESSGSPIKRQEPMK